MQLNEYDEFYFAEQLGTAARIIKSDSDAMILETVEGLQYIALEAKEQDGKILSSFVERVANQNIAESMLREYCSQNTVTQHEQQAKSRGRR